MEAPFTSHRSIVRGLQRWGLDGLAGPRAGETDPSRITAGRNRTAVLHSFWILKRRPGLATIIVAQIFFTADLGVLR